MSELESVMDALARMSGVSMAAVVDAESGHCLACRHCSTSPASSGGDSNADAARALRLVERAARYVAATATAARRNTSSGRLPVESVLSLRQQCHVVRSIPGAGGGDALLIYLAFDRAVLDLARARRIVEEATLDFQLSQEERRVLQHSAPHRSPRGNGG